MVFMPSTWKCGIFILRKKKDKKEHVLAGNLSYVRMQKCSNTIILSRTIEEAAASYSTFDCRSLEILPRKDQLHGYKHLVTLTLKMKLNSTFLVITHLCKWIASYHGLENESSFSRDIDYK